MYIGFFLHQARKTGICFRFSWYISKVLDIEVFSEGFQISVNIIFE